MAELVLVRDPWRNIWGPELSNVLVFHLFVFVCEIFSFFPLHICDQYIWQWINQKFWNLYECLLKITGRTLTHGHSKPGLSEVDKTVFINIKHFI